MDVTECRELEVQVPALARKMREESETRKAAEVSLLKERRAEFDRISAIKPTTSWAEILGVKSTSTPEEVRERYDRLLRLLNPANTAEPMAEAYYIRIQRAYDRARPELDATAQSERDKAEQTKLKHDRRKEIARIIAVNATTTGGYNWVDILGVKSVNSSYEKIGERCDQLLRLLDPANTKDPMAQVCYNRVLEAMNEHIAHSVALSHLRAYIHKVRNSISADEAALAKVSTEEQRAAVLALCKVVEEWLQEDGRHANVDAVKAKLLAFAPLARLCHPLSHRLLQLPLAPLVLAPLARSFLPVSHCLLQLPLEALALAPLARSYRPLSHHILQILFAPYLYLSCLYSAFSSSSLSFPFP